MQREKWTVDPFGAVLKDGFIWGRGTADDKDVLTANLMVMLLLKRSAIPLDRDVIFLAEAGEETDPTDVGIHFMVEQHFDEINAEFALTEGGATTIENGRVTTVHRHYGKGAPASASRGKRRFRAWIGPASRQRFDSFGRCGSKGGQLGNAHAPERHDAGLF